MPEKEIQQHENHQHKCNEHYPASCNVEIYKVSNGNKIQDGMKQNCNHPEDKAVKGFG